MKVEERVKTSPEPKKELMQYVRHWGKIEVIGFVCNEKCHMYVCMYVCMYFRLAKKE